MGGITLKDTLVMDIPKWISWAGLAAVVGGLLTVLLTAPFVTAYFYAYPGHNVPPFWIHSVKDALGSWLTFASPQVVYDIYGRIYDVVYLLFLPAAFGLHQLHQGAGAGDSGGAGVCNGGLLLLTMTAVVFGLFK